MNEIARLLLNLPPQASTVARSIDLLHYFVIGVTMLGSSLVFLAGLLLLIRYRRRGDTLTPRVVGSIGTEVVVISGILSLFLLIWVLGYAQFRVLQRPPDDALEVYVVGKQWMWKFAYPQGPASVGVLYVPANRPVKLLLTSRDVIHSFFVPAFRVKQDAVPGRYTVVWFEALEPGTHPIRCAEYCGVAHSGMLGDVVVLSPADYERWLAHPTGPTVVTARAENDPSFPLAQRRTLADHGERAAADAGCLRCHTLDGTPHIGPTFSGLFGRRQRLADGTTVVVDEAYLTESMMDPRAKIVAGFEPVMPSYHGRLEPADTAAIVEFIKSLTPTDARAAHPAPLPVPAGGAR